MTANAEPTPVGDDVSRGKALLSFTQGIVPLVIAVIVLYVFWDLVKTMMGKTQVPELEWNRAAYLFAGVEAIAYAAAGFLFGREVHRQRAEQAERRASSEQARATEAVKKAAEETTKGKALKQVIEAKKGSQVVRLFGPRELGGHGADRSVTEIQSELNLEGLDGFKEREMEMSRQSDLDELSRVANELFP